MKRTNEASWNEAKQRWYIKVQRDGVRKQFTSSIIGRKGKLEAEGKADDWLDSRDESTVRFAAVWEEYLQHVRSTTGVSNYAQRESIGRNWLLPMFKNKIFSSITPNDWQKCITHAYKKGLAKKSLENIRGTITNLCKFARKARIIRDLPFDLDVPRGAPTYEKQILLTSDLQKLFSIDTISGQPAHWIHAWRFAVLTGVRPGECYGLKWTDIKGDTIHLQRAINSRGEQTAGKNKNARRTLFVSAHVRKVLSNQKEMLRKRGIVSPWVFPTEDGKAVMQYIPYYAWCKYKKEHNLSDCTPYEMRHTMISLAKADVPPELLKQMVGHSKSMDTFGVYGHEVEGENERVAGMLDALWDKIVP